MIIIGLSPKLCGVFILIPDPIEGAMYCAMFGMITATGISFLRLVDMTNPRNQFVFGMNLFFGIAMQNYVREENQLAMESGGYYPNIDNQEVAICFRALFGTSYSVSFLLGVILDNSIPDMGEERGYLPGEHTAGTGGVSFSRDVSFSDSLFSHANSLSKASKKLKRPQDLFSC